MQIASSGRAILVWGTTFSLFLLVSYAACIIYGLAVPAGYEMHRAWAAWLPGFEWLTAEASTLSLVLSGRPQLLMPVRVRVR